MAFRARTHKRSGAFNGAVFTNISRDHLDYHGSMNAYVSRLKLKLVRDTQGLSFVVVNMDDHYVDNILSAVPENGKEMGVYPARK